MFSCDMWSLWHLKWATYASNIHDMLQGTKTSFTEDAMTMLKVRSYRQTWNLCSFQNLTEHPDLQKLCDFFPLVKYAGETIEIPGGFQPELLLPGTRRWLPSEKWQLMQNNHLKH